MKNAETRTIVECAFRFGIADCGFEYRLTINPKSKIQNPKSKRPYFVRASAVFVDFSVFKLLLNTWSSNISFSGRRTLAGKARRREAEL
jgi:hypothetical protein